MTKASMAKSTLFFPERSVDFTLRDGFYSKGIKDSYELLDDVDIVNGKNSNAFRLRGNVIWGQDNLIRELESGTKIIIKTDSFVPYVDKGEQGTLRPAKIISKEIVGDVLAANAEIRNLFGDNPFNYPKPVTLIKYLINFRTENQLILDFFAGSGTTAHAVMDANNEDGKNRRFIIVQFPEFLDANNKDQAYAAEFCTKNNKPTYLTELTKMRLRKAGEHYARGLSALNLDNGFRVFRLDSSNIRPWEAQADNLSQTLMDAVEHIKEGRTEQDLLFELLLKLGLDLTVPMEQKTIAGKTVHSIGAGVLMVCLDEAIAKADYEALGNGIVAWHRELAPTGETTLVFRDSAFADDVVKTNLTAILEQYGIPKERIRSL